MALHVVDVDVFTGLDVAGGDADVLAVLHHGLALGNVPGSQLVINGDILQCGEGDVLAAAGLGHSITLGNGLDGDGHIVLCVDDHCITHG